MQSPKASCPSPSTKAILEPTKSLRDVNFGAVQNKNTFDGLVGVSRKGMERTKLCTVRSRDSDY